MKTVDIALEIQKAIENVIFDTWKHDGYVNAVYDDGVQVCIDGKSYTIVIEEDEQ